MEQKQMIYNIKTGKGQFTGNLKDGTPVTGTYIITPADEVVLQFVMVSINKDEPEYSEGNTYYELDPSQVDFDELTEVIEMRLGGWPRPAALRYLREAGELA